MRSFVLFCFCLVVCLFVDVYFSLFAFARAQATGNMPSGIGSSYRSLADDVYKTTTIEENKFSVIETMKRAFSLAGPQTRRSDPLILRAECEPRVVAVVGVAVR